MFRCTVNNGIAGLVDRLLPAECALCGQGRSVGLVCQACVADLPWIAHACARCGTPIASPLPAGVFCGNCQQRPAPFDVTIAPLHYAFPVDAAIKALKFGRRLHLAPALAALMENQAVLHEGRFDALVPVPLYRWRQALRGFNQAEELARHIRGFSGLPVRCCAERVRRTEPQSGLDATRRRYNLQRAFRMVSAPQCRHALIVDDVMTTGETCRSLAATLLASGVERVSVLAIARASP